MVTENMLISLMMGPFSIRWDVDIDRGRRTIG
jgi:hypothetical protein